MAHTEHVKPRGSNWVKIKIAQLKINLHSPIVRWMLIKDGKGIMIIRCILTELLECKVHENAYVSLCQHFFKHLSCNNSVYVSWFFIHLLQFLPNLNHMVSHGLNLLASDLMAYISKATRNWNVQH